MSSILRDLAGHTNGVLEDNGPVVCYVIQSDKKASPKLPVDFHFAQNFRGKKTEEILVTLPLFVIINYTDL